MRSTRFTNDAAVRIFLNAQGFCDPRPQGRIDARHFAKLVSRLRLIQIDSVNVVTRAHYLPAFARLGSYDRHAFDRWIYDGANMFEYWNHEASFAPMSFHTMMGPRMARFADDSWKGYRQLRQEMPDYIEAVYDEVVRNGPLAHRDLADPGEKTGPWWGYGKGKQALEYLFLTGRVTVASRVNFERRYDLPERVFPPDVLARSPMSIEAANQARVGEAAGALGIGTVADLADFFRMNKTPTAAAVAALVAAGDLVEVEVEGWDKAAYVLPDVVVPRRRRGTALMSPFDTIAWDRCRTERMFGFHYRIEIYTPAPKRVYGYYVLPFMMDGHLVGRVDVKADRKAGVLRALGMFAEEGVDRSATGRALAGELELMAGWLGLDDVAVAKRGNLAAATRKALR